MFHIPILYSLFLLGFSLSNSIVHLHYYSDQINLIFLVSVTKLDGLLDFSEYEYCQIAVNTYTSYRADRPDPFQNKPDGLRYCKKKSKYLEVITTYYNLHLIAN